MKQKLSFFIFLLTVGLANAQVEEKKLDELIQNTLKTFDVPGMSVGIVKGGKMIYSKGFGVRSLTTKQPMDDNTLVGIASNSKGFTCTALAILADEGKLNWDDKVSKYIPVVRNSNCFSVYRSVCINFISYSFCSVIASET